MARRFLREIPSVDEVLRSEILKGYARIYSKNFVTQAVRDVLGKMRESIISGHRSNPSLAEIETSVKLYLENMLKPSLKEVINASGVILHTNLGRAILCEEAVMAIKMAATSYVNLELNLLDGKREVRDSHVEELLCRLTDAEAATVVNNNAAAILLTLNSLADGRDVIISRGELVEIGGSFRIPEIILKSGCRMVEVGTTNRTHPADYISSINAATSIILKAHTSNYRVIGFTSSVDLKSLVMIGKQYGVPVVEDLGSGSLIDLSLFKLPKEPVVRESVNTGADIVTFSADKLLGGPQAGIIVGKKRFIDVINKNPLKRALRVDKFTIAGLEATLRLYLKPDILERRLPVLRFLTRPISEIEKVAERAVHLLQAKLGKDYVVEIEDDSSQIGSGSLPEEVLPTKIVSISNGQIPPERIFKMFLEKSPPVLGRIHKDRFLLDMRAIEKAEDVVI